MREKSEMSKKVVISDFGNGLISVFYLPFNHTFRSFRNNIVIKSLN